MKPKDCAADRRCAVRTALVTALILLIWASLLTLLLARKASAGAAAELGLEEAVALALRENPGVRAFLSSVKAGREEIGVARSYLLPSVTLEERFTRTDNPTMAFSAKLNQERFTQSDFAVNSLNGPDDINDFQSSVSVEQPIFVKEAWVRLDMAKAGARAMDLDFARKKEAVALQVVRAYLGVQTAREGVEAARAAVEDAAEHRRAAQARQDSGLGLYSDTLRADAALKEAEQGLIRARKNLELAKRGLGLLLGLDGPVEVRDEAPEPPVWDLALYEEAALRRSDVMAMRARVENAANSVRLAQAAYWPTLGLAGSYQLNDHGGPLAGEGESYRVMAVLRWSAFDGARRRHETAKARYGVEEAEAMLDGLRKEALYRVHEAWLGVDEARKALELAGARRDSAEEGVRLVRKRYENSLATMADLLAAQAALDAARASAIEKANDLRAALWELRYQSGTILDGYERSGDEDETR